MKKSGSIFLLLALTITHLGFSQNASSKQTEKINLVIKELFDGYRAGDSTRVRAVFTAGAHAQTVLTTTNGVDKLSELKSIDNFVNYIGGGLAEIHDERLWDMKIHADDQLATVWCNYAFFLGDKFIHCGTETFLLRKEKNDWKIFYLIDTRRNAGCKLPAEIKK